MAVCLRQADPDPGGLGRALDAGEVIRSYAFRGGSYAFVPEIAAVVLSVRTATRVWETRRWQEQGGFALDDWGPLRDAVCTALVDGPLTRAEIVERLGRIPALRHLSTGLQGAGADSLYKPLHGRHVRDAVPSPSRARHLRATTASIPITGALR